MEEESFEHEDVAKILNKYFISIKVDKEEFPNVDKRYQYLLRAHTGQRGGWPLSIFLTPNLEVYDIATYMPRDSYGGSEDIMTHIKRVGKLYGQKTALNKEIQKFLALEKKINQKPTASKNSLALNALIKHTLDKIIAQYDRENSGFATGRTKFPEASKIQLLLNIYKTNGDKHAYKMAKETLLTMSKRGIYDQIDGGFFRYADKEWRIPHFQKFLYVNAQMSVACLDLYRLTKDTYFYNIAKDTIDEMERHYRGDALYFSASDSVATKGEEGLYYTYMYDKTLAVFKKKGFSQEESEELLEYLNIEEIGNLDGDLAHINIMDEKAPAKLAQAKTYFKKLRLTREFPILDKKIVTSFNAMMIKALYTLAQYDADYLPLAEKRLHALLSLMLTNDTLYHQTIGDKKPTQKAHLEDYAYLVDALLTAHQTTLDKKHLTLASKLAHQAKALFYQKGVWYLSTQAPLVKADFDDKYYSAPLPILLNSFVTLANLHDDLDLAQISEKILKEYGAILEDKPQESASFVTLAMRHKLGVITLKAKKERLLKDQKKFLTIPYPFILKKPHPYDEYMACKLGLCFATGKNFKDINATISKMKSETKEEPKKKIWGR